MKKSLTIIVVLLILVLGGYAAYSYAFRPLAEPSNPAPVEMAMEDEQMDPADEKEQQDESIMKGDFVRFVVDPSQSSVEFQVNEILRNNPYTAVGETSNVSGEILVNVAETDQSDIGTISVNARTFKTDDQSRDRMIGRFILQSEEADKELITFDAEEINGIPIEFVAGESYDVEVTGLLTIRGETNTETFRGTFTLESMDRMVIAVESTVSREDYGITIPSVPQVASVDDDVLLKAELVAEKF